MNIAAGEAMQGWERAKTFALLVLLTVTLVMATAYVRLDRRFDEAEKQRSDAIALLVEHAQTHATTRP